MVQNSVVRAIATKQSETTTRRKLGVLSEHTCRILERTDWAGAIVLFDLLIEATTVPLNGLLVFVSGRVLVGGNKI